MHEFGISDGPTNDVALAVTEACANVVEHAAAAPGPDEFELRLDLTAEECVVRVADRGTGFASVGPTTYPPDPSSLRGRGIFLMRALVDRVHFDERAEGTIVQLEKHLDDERSVAETA